MMHHETFLYSTRQHQATLPSPVWPENKAWPHITCVPWATNALTMKLECDLMA